MLAEERLHDKVSQVLKGSRHATSCVTPRWGQVGFMSCLYVVSCHFLFYFEK